MIYTLETFEQELKKRFPNNDITVLTFTKTNAPMSYKCNTCGKIYEKARANHLYENKTLCQKCYTSRKSKLRDWILDFIKNSKQFDFYKPWYGATSENLELYCHKCNRHFQKQPANLYLREENTVCPFCGENGSPVPFEDFYNKLSEQEKKEYTFLEYKGMNVSAKIRHSCGYVFNRKPANFLKSKGCPKCEKTMPVGEITVERFLLTNNIVYEKQKHFPDLSRYSYDFYLPELKTLIEYQGQQHYEPVKVFGGEEQFKIQKKRDLLKKEYAEKNGYFLLEIPYYHLYKIESYLLPLIGSTTNSNLKQDEKESTQCEDIV